jgi:tRNA(Ile)-lysidine synthase
MDLFERFNDYIDRHTLLQQGERVIIGVSGGADSLCLLDLLTRWGVEPIVAHLDHQLRQESASEAEFVQEVAQSYAHAFELSTVAVDKDHTGSLEEQARLARYRFLVNTAHKYSTRKILVGHTFDDQVETILMHFLRGAGPAGLRGMLPATEMDDWVGIPRSEGILILRPLLQIRHAEALKYCEEIGLQPRFDRSNLDRTYFRNRIRHELIPILEEFNPGIRNVVYSLGEVMRSEVEFLEAQVESHWSRVVEILTKDDLILRWDPIHDLPFALQRGLLRRAILELRPDLRDLGFEQIERARRFMLDLDRPASQPVISDLTMHQYAKDVLLSGADQPPALPDHPQIIDTIRLEAPFSGIINLAYGWSIKTSELVGMQLEALPERGGDAWDVVLDQAVLAEPLNFRKRQAGDRMQPLGMQGNVKISDLMINRKIPRLARERWPLLISGGEIAWVPGIHIAHAFRLTDRSHTALRLKVIRP